MNPRSAFLLFAAVASLASALRAREVAVPGPAQLASALGAARAGDVVVLKGGEWSDAKLIVSKGGTAAQPIEIRAETPGGVTLRGGSFLAINAPHVVVSGLLFHGGTTGESAVIQFNSHHAVVRDTAIVDYNPAAFASEYYWVFFNGDDNRLERCYFKGKNNLHPLVGNAVEGSRRNSVVRCFFKNIPYVAGANGREIIRVWGSGKTEERDEDGAFFTIAENLFDHADGEGVETISLKSNHNLVRANTVVATLGGINIRRGNFNTVADNIVLGQHLDGAHGLRMSGRDNVVRGNFIAGCDYGIRVSCGEFIASSLTPAYAPDVKPNGRRTAQVRIPTYPQVVRLTLAENVVVATSGTDLEIGSDYKKHWPESQQVLLPEACMIKNNRFVRPEGGPAVAVTAAEAAPPLNRFAFKPNLYAGNVIVGGRAPADLAAGFSAMPLPAGWTETGEQSALKPLTPRDVGPAWVVARRDAGDFAIESAASAEPDSAAAPVKGKKKKKKGE